jgi:DNA invertase Pin-like site-specific DNA recombinase
LIPELPHKSKVTPVVQYLRMSTEHQQYSTANQSIAILQYAQEHDMEVVRTYADHGKSGLGLSTRSGLKRLLADAVVHDPGFEAVLVYDVSRWGRFQNPDQGASYEYALELANIRIHYCAEQFQNDGTLASSILKTLKRGMAGEYSRELSEKVWVGNRRIAELGFHIGGYAGYGLRRQLVGQDGKFKQILNRRDIKGLQSDHVLLVPGPKSEIRVVHRIYRMYIEQSLPESEIAKRLNDEGVPWSESRPWTRMCIRHILTNPKYIGVSVYNRTSFKLHKTKVRNPRNEWIWRAGAFEAIVTERRFEQARIVAISRVRTVSTQYLLDSLRALINSEGRVSERLIESIEGMPSATTYINRFGSLRNAYARVGWKSTLQQRFIDLNAIVADHRSRSISAIIADFSPLIMGVEQNKKKCLFTCNCGILISFVVARCSPIKNHDYWNVYFPPSLSAHFYVVARLKPGNNQMSDYFIFVKGVLSNHRVTLGAVNTSKLEVHRFDDLVALGTALRHTKVEDSTTDRFEGGSIPTEDLKGETLRLPPNNSQSTLRLLFRDENFRTLLRAESLDDIPDTLLREVFSAGDQMLAKVVNEFYVTRILKNVRIRRYISNHHSHLMHELEWGRSASDGNGDRASMINDEGQFSHPLSPIPSSVCPAMPQKVHETAR